ncbi:CCAAT/enhancer-binding protein zeta [Orussus abietinus]|uniref:CCAAT/enhancer-binding protein zeta n=1 Tax=Orussus abietinus TaxID=222816 RepID=UPI000625947D|nr:CCAAT/enhancer-binding protein zeta [Orussus abietinus]
MKEKKKIFTDDLIDYSSGNRTKWYSEFVKAEAACKHTKSEVEVLDLAAEAKKCLDGDALSFQLKQSKSRDPETAWLNTALTQGTSSDKVAASIVLVQDNPKYNLKRLTSLVSQVRVAKHNQCNMIITSLRDLFLGDLLHPNHKLLKFEEQDLDKLDSLNPDVPKRKLLAHWYFEDQLRELYERFIASLSMIASESIEVNREKAVSVLSDLLRSNPEQEQKLLETLVNKIGDPNSKVASKTVYCLTKVLHEHPNMKLVVLKEVERLLFRKNIAQRAQYYAICLLTQFTLSKGDNDTANNLVDVYFAFFKACLKKGEPDSRMMAAILTGVTRAYPFVRTDTNQMQDHIDSVYKVVHVGSFNVSLNALSLLYQVTGKDEAQSNRFYSTFYRKLLDPQIGVVSKRAVFLNLLYRVLRGDPSITRLCASLKRLFQAILYYSANMACATLYVISKVLQSRKDAKYIFQRCRIFVKQEHNHNLSNGEDLKLPKIEEANVTTNDPENSIILPNIQVESVVDMDEDDTKDELQDQVKDEENRPYDPFCRNPLHANAARSFFYEFAAMSAHYHPSVSLFANTIAQGNSIKYTGDPLEDLTLIRFLDRYVFKNPKKLDSKKVSKKNDPLAQRTAYIPRGVRAIPVASEAYINESIDRIPVDELYLYRYLKKRKELKCGIKKEEAEEDDDNDSVNSEDFNSLLDQMGKGKNLNDLDELDDFDVAADFGSAKKKKGNATADSEEEDEIDEMDDGVDEENISEEELDDELAGSDIDLEDLDEDLSDIEFSDDGEEDESVLNDLKLKDVFINQKTSKKPGKKGKKNSKDLQENVFVSAEKFAEMLEQQGRSKFKQGGANVLSDMDGASSKQLDWEVGRNQRIKGHPGKRKWKPTGRFKREGTKKFKR